MFTLNYFVSFIETIRVKTINSNSIYASEPSWRKITALVKLSTNYKNQPSCNEIKITAQNVKKQNFQVFSS